MALVGGVSLVTIGGTVAGSANLISGDNLYSGRDVALGGSDNTIEGNLIGTDITGEAALPLLPGDVGGIGVFIIDGATGNTVGGTSAAARNIISGIDGPGVFIGAANATDSITSDNVIEGNFIGTDALGTTSLANTGDGVEIASGAFDNTIGGTVAGASNVISGNTVNGVEITGTGYVLFDVTDRASGNVVVGNDIGTNAAGSAAIANGNAGVEVDSSVSGNTIGGTAAGAGNVISGNTGSGVVIDGTGLPAGTLLYLKADDNTNNSGSDNALGVTLEGGVTYGTGVTGQAFQFNDTPGERVVVSDPFNYLAADAVTVSAWINLNSLPGATPYVIASQAYSATSENYGLYVNSSGELVFEWYSAGAFNTLTSSGADLGSRLGVFKQVAVVSDGSTVTFYVNGVAVSSSAMPVPLDNSASGNLEIGGLSQGPNLFNGLIDELSVTTGPLPADEIARIYANAGMGTDLGGSGTEDNTVAGNFIGTSPAGTIAIANGGDGVEINDGLNNLIGAPNIISGNAQDGVEITGPHATGNVVAGDFIGTDITGTVAIANGNDGVEIDSGATGNMVGGAITAAANLVSGNTGYGIQVDGSTTAGDVVANNWVGTGANGSGSVPNGGGALEITNGAAVLAQGTFTGNVLNEGTLGFWDTPSVITIVGNYTQSAAGILDVDLGGTSSSQYDQLLVSGTATLAGTLDVDLIDAFSIGLAEEFQVLTYDVVSGTFTTDEYPTGVTLFPDYTSTILYLFSTSTELVTTTADSGAGSLRQAIASADSVTNPTDIAFDIPNSDAGYADGVWTISPDSALPAITEPVILDGTSQPGYAGTPIIVLIGTDAGSSASGLILDANGSSILGLVIDDFGQDGISVQGNDNTVAGDYVGVTATGMTAAGNTTGIVVTGAGNTIGGTTALARDIISGNTNDGVEISGTGATGNVVAGDYIGVNFTGTVALPDISDGVEIDTGASGNTIGGLTATPGTGPGDVISGNNRTAVFGSGVYITGTGTSGNVIAGDLIGTDVSGTLEVANYNGVYIYESPDNTIGGGVSGAGNLISGNAYGIILFGGGTTHTVIAGNKIGTDITGTLAVPNAVGMETLQGTSGNTIGGSVPGDANLISGNSDGIALNSGTTGTIIAGNKIGTDITGTIALPNSIGIYVLNAPDNMIGGSVSGDANLISGNTDDGIDVYGFYGNRATGTIIAGNKIGTDITGTFALPNSTGIVINHAPDTMIGGSVSGDANLISGNTDDGIDVYGSTATDTIIAGNRIGTDITGTFAVPNAIRRGNRALRPTPRSAGRRRGAQRHLGQYA